MRFVFMELYPLRMKIILGAKAIKTPAIGDAKRANIPQIGIKPMSIPTDILANCAMNILHAPTRIALIINNAGFIIKNEDLVEEIFRSIIAATIVMMIARTAATIEGDNGDILHLQCQKVYD